MTMTGQTRRWLLALLGAAVHLVALFVIKTHHAILSHESRRRRSNGELYAHQAPPSSSSSSSSGTSLRTSSSMVNKASRMAEAKTISSGNIETSNGIVDESSVPDRRAGNNIAHRMPTLPPGLMPTSSSAANNDEVFGPPPTPARFLTPTPYSGHNSTAACLLLMDDNHRLAEWLSYHYFAASLRYLVVAVDPNSQTRPEAILARFAPYVTIHVWNDTDFTATHLLRPAYGGGTAEKQIVLHRKRQSTFYRACTAHMMQQHRTWTMYHDVDEYLALNGHFVLSSSSSSSAPGIRKSGPAMVPATVLQQPGHVLTYLQSLRAHNWTEWYLQHFAVDRCLALPRAQYGAVVRDNNNNNATAMAVAAAAAHNNNHNNNQIAPPTTIHLDTYTFRYRTTSQRHFIGNGLTKTILDVSAVAPYGLDWKGQSQAHKALRRPCQHTPRRVAYDHLPLHLHHYVGTLAAYTFRADVRKSAALWYQTAQHSAGGADDELTQWWPGLVNMLGVAEVQRLLHGAGMVHQTA